MKKGKKFWTIRMDNKGLYDVVPITYERTANGLDYFRMPTVYEGKADSIVVDIKAADLFGSLREAATECSRRCIAAAERWMKRASDLMVLKEMKGAKP